MSAEPWVEWEDQGQRKGYTEFPKVVQFDRSLSRHARFLYSLLLGYAWQDEECFPGQETLMLDMGCKDEQLRKYMIELRDAGLVTWKRRGQGKPNLYTIKSLSKTRERGGPETPKRGVQKTPKSGDYKEASTEEASKNSRRDAGASPEGQKNWFTFFCNAANALEVRIEPEDRKETSKHFKDLMRTEKPTEEEMKKVVSKMLEARTAGAFWSPQKCLTKVRNGNVHQLYPRAAQQQAAASTAGYRRFE